MYWIELLFFAVWDVVVFQLVFSLKNILVILIWPSQIRFLK